MPPHDCVASRTPRCGAIDVCGQRSAASRSTHQITRPSVSRTPAAGYVSGSGTPVRTSCKARAFVDPVTRTNVLAPRVRAGSVNVRRNGGSAGVFTATTQRVRSPSAGDPGKSEAVWPSAPSPRRIRSRRGGPVPK